MRPRRIARRLLARLRHWGGPHVHCPGCGADSPVPAPDVWLRCFTCGIYCLRVNLSGDEKTDQKLVRSRTEAHGGQCSVLWHPLLIDSPDVAPGEAGLALDAAFVYRCS